MTCRRASCCRGFAALLQADALGRNLGDELARLREEEEEDGGDLTSVTQLVEEMEERNRREEPPPLPAAAAAPPPAPASQTENQHDADVARLTMALKIAFAG